MTNLSPQAQAVLDAAHDVMPYTSIAEVRAIVAVLRAVAVVVSEDEMDHYAPDILHDIANELDTL